MRFELIQCGPGCENIRRERVDIPKRPGQHGCDHRRRDARRAVLAREWRAAGDLKRGPPTPGREAETRAGSNGRHARAGRSERRAAPRPGGTHARRRFADGRARHPDRPVATGRGRTRRCRSSAKLMKSAQPVEHGAYGAGRQARPQAALRLAQTGVEVFLGRETLRRIGQQAEIDAAMAAPGVLAEHGGRHVPAALAEQWQGCCGNARRHAVCRMIVSR